MQINRWYSLLGNVELPFGKTKALFRVRTSLGNLREKEFIDIDQDSGNTQIDLL